MLSHFISIREFSTITTHFGLFFIPTKIIVFFTISILQVHFVTSLIIVFIRGKVTLRTLAHVQKFLCHRALVFSTAGSLANIQNKRYSSLGGPVCVVAEPFPEKVVLVL